MRDIVDGDCLLLRLPHNFLGWEADWGFRGDVRCIERFMQDWLGSVALRGFSEPSAT